MKLSRRRFQLLTGAALGASLLPRWATGVRAQSAQAPMRFLAVRTPHGVDRDYWIPRQASGADPASTDQALAELSFDYPDSVLGPMMPWRDKISVLDGLDTQISKEMTRSDRRNYHGHNEQGTLLTGAEPPADRNGGYDNHPSLDFYLHARLPSPALLTAAVEGSGTWKCMSYDDAGNPRDPETDPRTLFGQAFPADFKPPAAGVRAVDYSAGEQLIAGYDQSALQALRSRLVGSERSKIDRHLDGMNRLLMTAGTGMLSGPAGMCMTSGADVPTRDGNVGNVAGVEEVARAHARVIAQAFACGRSRVATLQILNDYPNYFSDLPQVRTPAVLALYGQSFRFHENLVHDYWPATGQKRTDLRTAYCAGLRWSATHFAAVLEELDKTPDPLDPKGGTILQNTIVFWHNEFGHDAHDNQETRHPCIIAGGGGKVLKLGRYLRLRDIQGSTRVPHNRLLTSICLAMGLGDVSFFGDRDMKTNANYQGPLLPLMV